MSQRGGMPSTSVAEQLAANIQCGRWKKSFEKATDLTGHPSLGHPQELCDGRGVTAEQVGDGRLFSQDWIGCPQPNPSGFQRVEGVVQVQCRVVQRLQSWLPSVADRIFRYVAGIAISRLCQFKHSKPEGACDQASIEFAVVRIADSHRRVQASWSGHVGPS